MKNDLLQELGSTRSGSCGSRTSVLSNALQVQTRAEAAAERKKKAKVQRNIKELQTRAVLEKKRQENELFLARKKRE